MRTKARDLRQPFSNPFHASSKAALRRKATYTSTMCGSFHRVLHADLSLPIHRLYPIYEL